MSGPHRLELQLWARLQRLGCKLTHSGGGMRLNSSPLQAARGGPQGTRSGPQGARSGSWGTKGLGGHNLLSNAMPNNVQTPPRLPALTLESDPPSVPRHNMNHGYKKRFLSISRP
mmetsp:Transcript_137805/g.239698  ORF Transcript_137805/g.239698 Transcript_137805/m.239698 type:complete len:115 (+) Transcript_137805:1234-1578(+)